MKRLLPIIFTLFICTENNVIAGEPITINSSSLSKDERNVKDFNGVAAGGPINVIIKLGDKESLRFEGDEEAIVTLISEVKSGILVIRPQNSWTSWAKKYENKQITAYVTAKRISSLTMSGNGSMNVSGTVSAEELAITLSGSGSIKAKIAVDKLTGVISGSGNVDLTGTTDVGSVTLSGSGNFGSKILEVNTLSTRISGSGNVNVTTDGKISAFISGSGHVYYIGNPEIKKTVLGSGGVSKR